MCYDPLRFSLCSGDLCILLNISLMYLTLCRFTTPHSLHPPKPLRLKHIICFCIICFNPPNKASHSLAPLSLIRGMSECILRALFGFLSCSNDSVLIMICKAFTHGGIRFNPPNKVFLCLICLRCHVLMTVCLS